MSNNKPLDTELYNRVKKIADLIYDKPSAYKSGYIVKTYKRYGGEYEGTKDKEGLDRWFKERWTDINDDVSLYPTYRPTIRINKNTPITKSELNKYEKEKQIKEKQIIKGDKNLQPFVSKEKIKELKKYSNPNIVFNKAKIYLGKNVQIEISGRKDKKYMVKNPENNKWVHFGGFNPPMEDFTKHKDTKRRDSYLKRATNIKGEWKQNKYSANNLSINLLW